jgi:DNA polymerase-3 subunit beta
MRSWARAAERLRAVATDGHRLAQAEIPAARRRRWRHAGVIRPRKTVLELQQAHRGPVRRKSEIALSNSMIQFRFDSLILTSKLIDGTFPDYERVIPATTTRCLRVDTRLLRRGGGPGLDDFEPRRAAP